MWADPVWISSLNLLTVATTRRTVGPLHLWQMKVSLGFLVTLRGSGGTTTPTQQIVSIKSQIWCFPMSAPVGMDNHGWDLVG